MELLLYLFAHMKTLLYTRIYEYSPSCSSPATASGSPLPHFDAMESCTVHWSPPEALPALKRNLSGLKDAGKGLLYTRCPANASALPKLSVQPQKDWPQLT